MRLNEATILLVDDEPELLEIFGAWLGRAGCRIMTAPNGSEALKVLENEGVDAMVSDIRMPIMDGVALVRRIAELGMRVPTIIFVSGFGDVDPREMFSLGVEMMLDKPLRRAQLMDALEKSLMTPEQRWAVAPGDGGFRTRVKIECLSLDEANARCDLQLGRGGCCFAVDRTLAEGQAVELEVRFDRENETLRAQGVIQWYAAGHAGMTFHYLDPESRGWMSEWLAGAGPRAFVPACRIGGDPRQSAYMTGGASMPR